MINQACIIVLGGNATESEKEDVDEIIKEHAIGCWNQFTDVWVVGGHPSGFWGDIIMPIISGGQTGFLVFDLPRSRDRGFWGAMVDADRHMKWLHNNYLD